MIMTAILIKFKCNINVWVETFAMRFYKVRLAVKAQGINACGKTVFNAPVVKTPVIIRFTRKGAAVR